MNASFKDRLQLDNDIQSNKHKKKNKFIEDDDLKFKTDVTNMHCVIYSDYSIVN